MVVEEVSEEAARCQRDMVGSGWWCEEGCGGERGRGGRIFGMGEEGGGGRGRRGRGFGGFDGVLVFLISFDSSGMVLGNQILVVEPAVMHRVPPPFLSVFLCGSLSVSRFSNLEFFFGPGRVLLSNDEPLSFFAHCFPRV